MSADTQGDRLNDIERIERAEGYLEGLANTIDDTLDDDSVDWSHELRSVAVELRNVALSLGMQQAGAVEALERVDELLAAEPTYGPGGRPSVSEAREALRSVIDTLGGQ